MKIKCKNCKDIIEGDNKGNYIHCRCGNIAIDQTPYYTRIIGDKKEWEEIPENIEEEILEVMDEKKI